MVREGFNSIVQEIEEKAGYNQAGEITKILAMLRLTSTSALLENPNDFDQALECCRAVTNIIAGKIKKEIIKDINEKVYEIEKKLPAANKTFISNGTKYFSNSSERIKLKRDIENLWRLLEKVQDEYGYGMFSEDDSGL